MDGFDDLLGPTRDALERNPFADPFGRSSSPDPWKTFQTPGSADTDEESTALAFGVEEHTTTLQDPDLASVPTSGVDFTFESHTSSEDPLDSAKALQDDESEPVRMHERGSSTPTEHAPLSTPKSPGFRESVSTPVDDVLTPTPLTPPAPVEKQSTPPRVHSPSSTTKDTALLTPAPPPPVSPTKPSALPSTSALSHTSDGLTASFTSPSSTVSGHTVAKPFYSPLDQPRSLDKPFSGLAIGGESINGWQSMGQGSQSMFVGDDPRTASLPDDEDDDDDKPILQARMSSLERAQRTGSPSLSVSMLHPDSIDRVTGL